MGLPFVFLPLLSCGSSRFSFAFPKMVEPCGLIRGKSPQSGLAPFQILTSHRPFSSTFPVPQRYASLARSPALEFIAIQSAALGFAYSEGAGWNAELFSFSESFRFCGFPPPKILSPRDSVRREDSQFTESPAGLPIPRLNLTISVASRQIIKLFAYVFQR